MYTERQEADTANQTERGQEIEKVAQEVYRIREGVEEVLRERMRVEKAPRGDIDPSRWTVDQRPFVWVATSKLTDDKVPGSPLWATWRDVSQSPVTPLPYAPYAPYASGLATTGGEAESDFKTSDCSTPVPREGKVLQSKAWQPELNGGQTTAPTTRSVFRCPQSFPASSVGVQQSNLRITFMPVVQELTEVRHSVDVWESSTSKEGGSQRSSSWVEDLIEGDCVQNAAPLKCTPSSGSAYTGKASRIIHHKASHSSRPSATQFKAERATASKDTASVFESLSDNDDQSDGEGVQIVSEKRRKRMLSNRASAQRSRQRRQERLDTLEVLVAELRVENAALTRRANLAALAAKKSEKENKSLRDRLGKQEPLPLSDTSNESDKTTENSDMAGNNNNNNNGGASWPYGASIEPTSNHDSSSADTGETYGDDSHSRESSPASRINHDEKAGKDNPKTWNNNISSSSFDFEFNSDPMESDAEAFCGGEGTLTTEAGVPEVANVKDLYQSAMMDLARASSFQNLDSYGIELEERNQEMDKKNFDSRSVEDIWLESLANCMK